METNQTLEQKYENAKNLLLKQAHEIVEIIVPDISKFGVRVVRDAFVANVGFAEGLSDSDVTKFKEELSKALEALSNKVRDSLTTDDDLWLDAKTIPEFTKTLEENQGVWLVLQEISESIQSFLYSKGLHVEIPAYKTPSCFVNGKYPPGIIEKYWAQLKALRGVHEELVMRDMEIRKVNQALRWDSL